MKRIMEKRMKVKVVIFIILILALSLSIYLITPKNCKDDEKCFNTRAAECKKTEAILVNQNNVFSYEIKGSSTDGEIKTCVVKVTLLKLEASATPNLRRALEGKGMLCHIPRAILASQPISKIENVNDYCTGPLKEVILQISLEKLYEVVVKNIGPLSLQFSQSLSKLNATSE